MMTPNVSANHRRRGSSLVEVSLATALSMTVLFVGISCFLLGMSSWVRGQGKIDAESGSQRAIRMVSKQLKEAMSVTVDADGYGLSFRLPEKDDDGNYTNPIEWDGVERRIVLDGTNLKLTYGEVSRVLCRGVVKDDPLGTVGTKYKVFTPGAGTITRSLNVMVVSTRDAAAKSMTSRSRETIYLRNVPELLK